MKNTLKTIKLSENAVSTLLSGAAVLMIAVLLFNYFRSINKAPGKTSSAATETALEIEIPTYTVQKGDTLWSIAEAKSGSGYKWNDLYAMNKDVISDPQLIEVGIKIKLLAETAQTNTQVQNYEVKSGDNLWNIAAEKCGSGFVWTKIAADNNLVNPGIIHRGNVLKIRCK